MVQAGFKGEKCNNCRERSVEGGGGIETYKTKDRKETSLPSLAPLGKINHYVFRKEKKGGQGLGIAHPRKGINK